MEEERRRVMKTKDKSEFCLDRGGGGGDRRRSEGIWSEGLHLSQLVLFFV